MGVVDGCGRAKDVPLAGGRGLPAGQGRGRGCARAKAVEVVVRAAALRVAAWTMVAGCSRWTAPGGKGVAAGGGAERGSAQGRGTQKVVAASQASVAPGGAGGRARSDRSRE